MFDRNRDRVRGDDAIRDLRIALANVRTVQAEHGADLSQAARAKLYRIESGIDDLLGGYDGVLIDVMPELSTRARLCLLRMGITSLSEIEGTPDSAFMAERTLGIGTLSDIRRAARNARSREVSSRA